jgi:hypothetical protein
MTYLKADLRGVQSERVAAIQKAEEQQCERRRTRRWKTNECVVGMERRSRELNVMTCILMHLPQVIALRRQAWARLKG